MVVASFFSTLLFSLAVTAHPVKRAPGSFPQSLGFTKHIIDEVFNIVEQDLLRIDFIKGIYVDIFGLNSPAVNKAVAYIATVGVGNPPTKYDIIIDTGSSNTWIGANKAYVPTSTSHKTSNSVHVAYGTGAFNGTEYIDQITISPDLVIPKQSIGVASEWVFPDNINGILGVGPTNLTNNTLSPDTTAIIPTVTDNLFADHTIAKALLSVSYEPITTDDADVGQVNGELTWGAIDLTKFIGAITFAPITTTPSSKDFWGIDADASYGDITLLSASAGIVDTGTTIVLIATDAFEKYKKATGGVSDDATGLLKITSDQYAKLKNLVFTVQGVSFELIPNAQIWPRKLNTALGGTAEGIYLTIADIGAPSGSGFDFLMGKSFLERFYSVYDTTNSRVGLARTKYTYAITN